MDGSIVRRHNSLGDGQSQTRAVFFITYKGTENGLLMFRGNPAAIVFDGDEQTLVMGKYL